MEYDYAVADGGVRKGRPWLRLLLLLAFGFVAGMIATGYALTHWDTAAGFLKTGNLAPDPESPNALVSAPPRAAVAPPVIVADQAGMDARIAQLESRIAGIDARAQAAVGNADRAEALLVAFAARRALDRGSALGYIETLLRDRFGGSQPQAVATIIGAAHQPVTLDELQAALETAAPGLMARSARESWWDAFRREVAGVVVLRRANLPSPAPEDRLARARNQLLAGHVDAALAEVSRMPGRASAAAWITLARRYVGARSALDAIETAALLTPREGAQVAATAWPAAAPVSTAATR